MAGLCGHWKAWIWVVMLKTRRNRGGIRWPLPAGYSLNWSGQYEYNATGERKAWTYVVPLTLSIIVLLYINFRNFSEVPINLGAQLPLPWWAVFGWCFVLAFNFSVAVGCCLLRWLGSRGNRRHYAVVFIKSGLKNASVNPEKGRFTRVYKLNHAVLHGAGYAGSVLDDDRCGQLLRLLPILYGTGNGGLRWWVDLPP